MIYHPLNPGIRGRILKVSLTSAKVALAGTAAPMPALADVLQPIGQIQPAEVQGVTCHRFVEPWHARATKAQGSV